MINHSIEQQYDLIRKPESVFILLCSSWRSSQSLHVPFKLERFQFFPLHYRIKGSLNGKVLPMCGRKKALSDFVTFLSLPFFYFLFFILLYITCVFCFLVFESVQFLCFALVNMFLFGYFQFCFIVARTIFFFFGDNMERSTSQLVFYWALVWVFLVEFPYQILIYSLRFNV